MPRPTRPQRPRRGSRKARAATPAGARRVDAANELRPDHHPRPARHPAEQGQGVRLGSIGEVE